MTTMTHPFTVNRSTINSAAKHIMLNFCITWLGGAPQVHLITYIYLFLVQSCEAFKQEIGK